MVGEELKQSTRVSITKERAMHRYVFVIYSRGREVVQINVRVLSTSVCVRTLETQGWRRDGQDEREEGQRDSEQRTLKRWAASTGSFFSRFLVALRLHAITT